MDKNWVNEAKGFKARFMLFSWRVENGVCQSEESWGPFPSANVSKDNMSSPTKLVS